MRTGSRTPAFLAGFDSATAMVRATAAFLAGRDFPALGFPPVLQRPATLVNTLPRRLRETVYILTGWAGTVPQRRLARLDAGELSGWAARQYPPRRYPALAIGSANGAVVHLCAALGMPWLPQTFLVPVRWRVHPDEPAEALRAGLEPARTLLAANPDLQLHHMHDASQDRLMARTMAYFRVKRLRLGPDYERFLAERLESGGTVFVIDCERTWPTRRVADRHVFQHGAVGGATEEEFHRGGPRVAGYLRRYGSHRRRWEGPEPDGRSPEAEWGFEPALLDDIERTARRHGHRVVRVRFPEPQAISPLVADLYRWWYGLRGIPADRLLIESFIVLEPWWTLRTGSTPLWTEFNTEPALRAASGYLDRAGPFGEICLMLFNHGVESVGVAGADQWRSLLARAGRRGEWLGGEPAKYPLDFAQYARYHRALRRLPARRPMPAPLALSQLDAFLAEYGDRYRVRWERLR
ncbi:hypothetical protein [Streptomyces aidingensis]|uniref:Uncharacterized protein n=1 Tax=Streptomyces aidingensis TaxID=910347 RepID=A0A1I1F0C9_9ACTN|nr:hypothetical protein [Streptomyces aidingensis]SFB92899.1 hypothetical protein SAMN05421773_101564 [Streptomyces aidingensis]